MRDIRGFHQHEGNRAEVVRVDGTVGVTTFDQPLTTNVAISVEDARKEGSGASIRAAREIGDRLGDEMTKRFFETIHEAVERVGNVLDAKGRPFSAELFAESLEKMDLAFDEGGEWQPPTIVVHPDAFPMIRARMEEASRDPAVKARLEEIVSRKREEWRAREARRTLVD